jgi:hypothetical protein
MDETEPMLEPTAESRVETLQGELQALRTLVTISLILLIVFSFCVNVFLFRQVAMARAQVTQAELFIQGFNTTEVADFWNKLSDFSRTHPDFAPIWAKYKDLINIRPNQAATGAKGK